MISSLLPPPPPASAEATWRCRCRRRSSRRLLTVGLVDLVDADTAVEQTAGGVLVGRRLDACWRDRGLGRSAAVRRPAPAPASGSRCSLRLRRRRACWRCPAWESETEIVETSHGPVHLRCWDVRFSRMTLAQLILADSVLRKPGPVRVHQPRGLQRHPGGRESGQQRVAHRRRRCQHAAQFRRARHGPAPAPGRSRPAAPRSPCIRGRPLRHGGDVAGTGRGRGVGLDLVVSRARVRLRWGRCRAWARRGRPGAAAAAGSSGCPTRNGVADAGDHGRGRPARPPRNPGSSVSAYRNRRPYAQSSNALLRRTIRVLVGAIANPAVQMPSSSGAIWRPRRRRRSGWAPSSGSASRSGLSV